MTKVSSNAGKHFYLRSDHEYIFAHIKEHKPGIELIKVIPKFKTVIDTGYVDKKKAKLFFKDIIIYNKEEYHIDYNAKEFYWIACSFENPEKNLKLSKIAKKCLLKISYNKT